MTRTLARRLATVGGALGIAVLACAGTAAADASDAHASGDVLVTNIGNEVGDLNAWGSHHSSGDTLVTNIGNEVGVADYAAVAHYAADAATARDGGWGDCPCQPTPPPPPPPCRPCPPPPCPPGWSWGWDHDQHHDGVAQDLSES